ncbi:biotin transporter BioY [Anaerocellum danielii]|uniref:biotin transporter BioY n=1 Tax=Anaerocellum danielii TaxID=1387557 RepID=UPI0009E29162|nr:biotin transporter BioY [Caldicellulosiruptor danielii]
MSTKNICLVSLFAALTAVGAYIKIPIPYVPFTLQLLFCVLAGLLLGPKLGALSQVVYVATGLIGIPIFAEGGGPLYIFKPTFGYLIGFILCAYIAGYISHLNKKRSIRLNLIGSLTGLFATYLLGVGYLYVIYNYYLKIPKSIGWALYWGFLVCVPGDIFLCIVASFVAKRLEPVLEKILLINTGYLQELQE